MIPVYAQLRVGAIADLLDPLTGGPWEVGIRPSPYDGSPALFVVADDLELASSAVVAGEHLLRGRVDPDRAADLLGLLSAQLTGAGVPHRLELYDAFDDPAGYWHHRWPEGEPFPG